MYTSWVLKECREPLRFFRVCRNFFSINIWCTTSSTTALLSHKSTATLCRTSIKRFQPACFNVSMINLFVYPHVFSVFSLFSPSCGLSRKSGVMRTTSSTSARCVCVNTKRTRTSGASCHNRSSIIIYKSCVSTFATFLSDVCRVCICFTSPVSISGSFRTRSVPFVESTSRQERARSSSTLSTVSSCGCTTWQFPTYF